MNHSQESTTIMNERNKKKLDDRAANDFNDDDCVSDAKLLQFVENNVSAEEREEIQKHLNECALCAEIVGAVYYNDAHPFTEEEILEARKHSKRSVEEQWDELFPPTPPSPRPTQKTRWWQQPPVLYPAYAAFAFLFFVGGKMGMHYYQTDYQYRQVQSTLVKRQSPGFTNVRFSGGYDPVILTAGETAKPQTYLDSSRVKIESALAHGGDTLVAQQLLLQVLTFDKKYSEADSLVRLLAGSADQNAALANDLGVYYFKRENWSLAKQYFETAIRQDAKYPEARFNLALTQIRLGEKAAALATLVEVLKLEQNEGWKAAAEDLQKRLQADPE